MSVCVLGDPLRQCDHVTNAIRMDLSWGGGGIVVLSRHMHSIGKTVSGAGMLSPENNTEC